MTRARMNGAETLGLHVHKAISESLGTRSSRWGGHRRPNCVGPQPPQGVKGLPYARGSIKDAFFQVMESRFAIWHDRG